MRASIFCCFTQFLCHQKRIAAQCPLEIILMKLLERQASSQREQSMAISLIAQLTKQVMRNNLVRANRARDSYDESINKDIQTKLILQYFALRNAIRKSDFEADNVLDPKRQLSHLMNQLAFQGTDLESRLLELVIEQHNLIGPRKIKIFALRNTEIISSELNKHERKLPSSIKKIFRTANGIVKYRTLDSYQEPTDIDGLFLTTEKEIKYNDMLDQLEQREIQYCPDENIFYIIMKDRGMTLKDFLSPDSGNDLIIAEQYKMLIHKLRECIKDAHNMGVAHADIKPSNICIKLDAIDPENLALATIYLIDLESACPPETQITTAIGTTGYKPTYNCTQSASSRDYFSLMIIILKDILIQHNIDCPQSSQLKEIKNKMEQPGPFDENEICKAILLIEDNALKPDLASLDQQPFTPRFV